jgi:NADP-dependent 3-hydroxy acid dehydrogenase YdfG
MAQVVLITGCSSGIGQAAASELAEAGHTVFATARNPDSLIPLTEFGCRTLQLDVTDELSMVDAVRSVQDEFGAVDVLINNAGYGLYGPIEQVSMADVRREFETNVFGLVRLTQLVLPAMRTQRRGRILNVSSMGGRTTLPGGGFYHASKHAVESLSDALRIEVRPFGIDVILIEPGVVRTQFADVAVQTQEATSAADSRDPYGPFKQAVTDSFATAYSGPLGRLSISADHVAKVITRAVAAPRPRTRYLISPMAKSLVAAKALLPDRIHDAVLKKQYGLP